MWVPVFRVPIPMDEDFLNPAEINRYHRQLILQQIGLSGQERLKSSSVVIIGLGGLGSAVAYYLAAAGVGELLLIDSDIVDESNLQRQILYTSADIGKPKARCAVRRLRDLNPYIKIEGYQSRLGSPETESLFQRAEVIVDAVDNFATRFLINALSLGMHRPMVHASIHRFEGRLTVLNYRFGPCYECLQPRQEAQAFPTQESDLGIFGAMAGILGSMQAMETLKLLLGLGQINSGKLLLFDGLYLRQHAFQFRKKIDCPACSMKAPMTAGNSLTGSGVSTTDDDDAINLKEDEIDVLTLKNYLDTGVELQLIDIRESEEREICLLPNSLSVPPDRLAETLPLLSLEDFYVAYCKVGIRSAWAVSVMREYGFQNVKNLKGGITEWALRVEPDMPVY